MRTAGETDISTPLMCIYIYFCCHLNAELEAFGVGVLLRQSDQRSLAVLDLS